MTMILSLYHNKFYHLPFEILVIWSSNLWSLENFNAIKLQRLQNAMHGCIFKLESPVLKSNRIEDILYCSKAIKLYCTSTEKMSLAVKKNPAGWLILDALKWLQDHQMFYNIIGSQKLTLKLAAIDLFKAQQSSYIGVNRCEKSNLREKQRGLCISSDRVYLLSQNLNLKHFVCVQLT